jgi:hypothetical protein
MRIHTYRDEAHSRHFYLIIDGPKPWSLDLVSVSASTLLLTGFVSALWVQFAS